MNNWKLAVSELESRIFYFGKIQDLTLLLCVDNIVLKSSEPDMFIGGISKLEFNRDKENKITGFNLSAMDIQNIDFTKKG